MGKEGKLPGGKRKLKRTRDGRPLLLPAFLQRRRAAALEVMVMVMVVVVVHPARRVFVMVAALARRVVVVITAPARRVGAGV